MQGLCSKCTINWEIKQKEERYHAFLLIFLSNYRSSSLDFSFMDRYNQKWFHKLVSLAQGTMDAQSAETLDMSSPPDEPQINVALLVDRDYLHRFRSIFSHMLVGLVDQPINVTLICSDLPATASLPIGPAKIIEFKVPYWPWQYKNSLDSLVAELRAAKVNLIHSCSGKACWLAVDLARELDVPYVITFNGLFQEECFLRVEHRHCGRLLGISEPICQALKDLYRNYSSKVEMIRPGCFIRPRASRPDRPKTIISVGEFNRQSGYDVLLRALAEVRNRGHEFLAFLFGHGPLEHSFHSWVIKQKLGNHISLLPILDNWEDILGDVDFYIQPGSFYALHSGPFEALAHGCPIIATKDTAMDLVIPGKTGLLFNAGDHLELADRLTEWLEGKLNWQELSDQSLLFARSEFSLARVMDKLIDVYRSVLVDTHSRVS